MALTKRERQARYRDRLKVRLAAPSIVALAASEVADEHLDEFHRAVRARLHRYHRDLGGIEGLAWAKVEQVKSLVDAEIVLEALTRDVQALTRAGHLWSMKTRRAAALLSDWVRLKEHRDRLLVAVGLEPLEHPDPADTLEGIVAGIVAARPAASVAAHVAPRGDHPSPGPGGTAPGPQAPAVAERGPDARVIRAAEQVHPAPRPRQPELPEPLEVTVPSLMPTEQALEAAAEMGEF